MPAKMTALGALALLGSAAHAQLIVGYDDVSGGTTCYEVRVSDGSNVATPLFSTVQAWGLASDDANRVLYVSSGIGLHAWTGAGEPTLLGNMSYNGSPISIVGLAFANGRLYGTTNISNEGIFEINVNSLEATLVLDYDDPSYDFGGFEYANGGFYGTNDNTNPFGTGLFSIDLNGSINKITEYPVGESDIDGLAIGNGIAYMIEDEGGASIHRYDLINGNYLTPLDSPFGTSQIFSSGAYASWVPAPGALALLAAGAPAATRRRR